MAGQNPVAPAPRPLTRLPIEAAIHTIVNGQLAQWSMVTELEAGSITIRGMEPDMFAAGGIDAGMLQTMWNDGTGLIDALFFLSCRATRDRWAEYGRVFARGNATERNPRPTINDVMVAVMLEVGSRGSITTDQQPLISFVSRNCNINTSAELIGLCTCLNDLRNYKMDWVLSCNPGADLDDALKGRLALGLAGHKALKFCNYAKTMFAVEYPDGRDPLIDYLAELYNVMTRIKFFHPAVNNASIINGLEPNFTHSVIGKVIARAADPATKTQLRNLGIITARDLVAVQGYEIHAQGHQDQVRQTEIVLELHRLLTGDNNANVPPLANLADSFPPNHPQRVWPTIPPGPRGRALGKPRGANARQPGQAGNVPDAPAQF